VSTAAAPARVGRFFVGVFEHLLPPTLYFFVAFNLQGNRLVTIVDALRRRPG
jgi:hypothetical protein